MDERSALIGVIMSDNDKDRQIELLIKLVEDKDKRIAELVANINQLQGNVADSVAEVKQVLKGLLDFKAWLACWLTDEQTKLVDMVTDKMQECVKESDRALKETLVKESALILVTNPRPWYRRWGRQA